MSSKPGIIGIGGQRCGSTSVFLCLKKSPDVFATEKELHFFDSDEPLDWDDYYKNFSADHISIDFTPAYSTLKRSRVVEIRENIPKAKIVFVVRNPIYRVISIVKANVKWYPKSIKKFDNVEMLLKGVAGNAKSHRSQYGRIVRTWTEVFGDQFHLYYFDDIVEKPAEFTRTLCQDMGVRLPRKNIGRFNDSPNYPIHPKAYEWLIEYFEPKIKSWEDVIDGRIINKWLTQIEDLRKGKCDDC